jgi:ribonucleoside-diphosphate reductase alpha chain
LDLKNRLKSRDTLADDLYYGLWNNDLFMKRVEQGKDAKWSLFCPSECPQLYQTYGEEFERIYLELERDGTKVRKTINAHKLWNTLVDMQIENSMPYMVSKDAANKYSMQKNLGTVQCSNLCVAPETFILTDKGQKRIEKLVNQPVRIWNGFEWSETVVRRTSNDAELLKVILSNGATLECTPQHKFVLKDGKTRVEAQNLTIGQQLCKWIQIPEPIERTKTIKYPYTHGLFCAEGTYGKNYSGDPCIPIIALYGEKKKLVDLLEVRTMSGIEDASGRLNIRLPMDLPKKFKVPLNASLNDKLRWFEGYCDGDGCVCRVDTSITIQITSIEHKFLDEIRLMLQTLGVNTFIANGQSAGQRSLPDGHGGMRLFNCKETKRLLVDCNALWRLVQLGFSPKRLDISGIHEPQRAAARFIKVVEVIRENRRSPTFCVNEPLRHTAVFNGILTGNCVEIVEFTSPEEM